MNEAADAELLDQSGALVAVTPGPPAAIVSADPTAVVKAFATYKEIQNALDNAMPDCIMEISGRKFRKKMYWRAIATAFNLSLEMVREERITEGDEDWGWLVTYRAIAPNGRSVVGDGSCFASEKWSDREKCPACGEAEFSYRSSKDDGPSHYCWKRKGGCGHQWTPAAGGETEVDKSQSTIHNIRSHAHTRAKNRAVADLVGFGEVSAEEMPLGEEPLAPARAPAAAPRRSRTQAPPPPRDESADPAAQAFLYQPGDEAPPEPKYRQWRGDAPTKNPASEFAKHTWSHMEGGSYGGKRYQWMRRVLAMPDPPASTAERARFCVFVIENREHNKRADMAAAKGEETPF
jgi:hypothetical protein